MIYLSFEPRGLVASVPAVTSPISYSHDIRALGGYRSAQFEFYASFVDAVAWSTQGLGTGVVVKNDYGQTIWEGFVNQVDTRSARATREYGPLTELSNKVACTYSTPDYEGLEKSYQRTTPYASDEKSIEKYGQFMEVFSGGTKDDTAALATRDRELARKAYPTIIDSTEDDTGQSAYLVSVDCAGWTRYLERSIYNYTADYLSQTTQEKIDLIFQRTSFANSSGLNSKHININGNVSGWEDKNRTGWAVIQGMLEELGVARAKVGMFDGRTFIMDNTSEDDVYERDFETGEYYLGGSKVLHSAVMPGMYVNSSAVGENIIYYIDSVSYDMSGNKVRVNHAERNIQAALRRAYGAY